MRQNLNFGGSAMSDDYGSDFITITDDEGQEYELELIDSIEYEDERYVLFLPADMDENSEDFGYIILKVFEEDGEEFFGVVEDDEELDSVYDVFMERLFADEDEPDEEE